MAVVGRHWYDFDLAVAIHLVAVCPVGIGVDCWGEAVALTPRVPGC